MQKMMQIAAIAVMALLCACSPDSIVETVPEPESPASTPSDLWMTIKISVPTATRGSFVSGTEAAQPNEYKIHDLNIFIFNDDDETGLNGSFSDLNPGEFYEHVYKEIPTKLQSTQDCDIEAHESDGTYVCKFPMSKKDAVKDNFSVGDRVIVIANAGNLYDRIKSMKDLRDYQMEQYHNGMFRHQTWKNNDEPSNLLGYSNFTMANAHESEGKVEEPNKNDIKEPGEYAGSERYPYTASVCLERTAARIDFLYDDGDNFYYPKSDEDADDAYFEYDVTSYIDEDKKNPVAKVRITHIIPVNVMQNSSYVLKHLAETWPESAASTSLCITEESKMHYVFDFKTFDKKNLAGTDEDDIFLKGLYDDTRRMKLIQRMQDVSRIKDHSIASIRGTKNCLEAASDDGAKNYSIVAYANENTFNENLENPEDYATGLVLRSVFVPKIVYGLNGEDETASVFETSGDVVERKTLHQVSGGDYTWVGQSFWRCSPSKDDGMAEKDSKYFSSEKAAKEYAESEMFKNEYPGRSPIITEFTNGVCYYNLWLRHTDYENTGYSRPGKMEYAIVRNTVYKVKVSFSGVGNDKPEIREPHNIRTRIYVRKWNLRGFGEIIV